MMQSRHKQQGMTAISIMMLLLLIGFNGMVVVKLLPTYLDSFKVSSAMKGLATDDRVKSASNDAVKTLLVKKLAIDDIEDLSLDDIYIEVTKSGRILSIDYERRIPMFGSLAVVITFGGDDVELR